MELQRLHSNGAQVCEILVGGREGVRPTGLSVCRASREVCLGAVLDSCPGSRQGLWWCLVVTSGLSWVVLCAEWVWPGVVTQGVLGTTHILRRHQHAACSAAPIASALTAMQQRQMRPGSTGLCGVLCGHRMRVVWQRVTCTEAVCATPVYLLSLCTSSVVRQACMCVDVYACAPAAGSSSLLSSGRSGLLQSLVVTSA